MNLCIDSLTSSFRSHPSSFILELCFFFKMSEPTQDRVNFDYIKSNLFRTARADGLVCGVNGHADIVLNFFSERTAIPKRSSHRLVGGRLGDEIPEDRVSRDAVVREVEISLSMNLAVAKATIKTLETQIKNMEAQMKTINEERRP